MDTGSIYREAVMTDGAYVLGQVVTRLYEGDDLRPDVYFKTDVRLRRKNYNAIFSSSDQRAKIQQSGLPENYDIDSGVMHFDISLLALLAEHTCGLTWYDPLLLKVKEVRDLRSRVSHSSSTGDVNDMNLNTKLQELLELYDNIISELEGRTYGNLDHVRSEVQQRIDDKKTGRPTWGKVTAGVVGAAAVVGILGAWVSSNSKNEEKRP